jgi:hypothetical protein
VRLGAVALTLCVGAPIARAGSSLVPVVSDDQAEWQRERPPAYLGFGSSVSTDVHVNADLFVEGAMRVATTPIWIHGLVGTGAETQLEDQGQFLEARGGFELSCATRRKVCGFFGVDVGGEMQSRRGDAKDGSLSGVVAVPRMGLDMGGDIVRVRASVDGRWFRYHTGGDDLDATAGGAGVSLALALRF